MAAKPEDTKALRRQLRDRIRSRVVHLNTRCEIPKLGCWNYVGSFVRDYVERSVPLELISTLTLPHGGFLARSNPRYSPFAVCSRYPQEGVQCYYRNGVQGVNIARSSAHTQKRNKTSELTGKVLSSAISPGARCSDARHRWCSYTTGSGELGTGDSIFPGINMSFFAQSRMKTTVQSGSC